MCLHSNVFDTIDALDTMHDNPVAKISLHELAILLCELYIHTLPGSPFTILWLSYLAMEIGGIQFRPWGGSIYSIFAIILIVLKDTNHAFYGRNLYLWQISRA